MADSLLTILQNVADELTLTRPTAVIGSSTQQIRTLLAHAQTAGRELMRAHQWTVLQTTGTVTTANDTSTYDLASDYDRMIQDTDWDRTNTWMMIGPDSPQINRYLNESGVAQTGTRKRFRLRGTQIEIWPTPTSTETLVYEYISNKWASSNGGTAQDKFEADTDYTVFDNDLMKMSIKWRYFASRGLYAADLKNEFDDLLMRKIAADIGGTKLNMEAQPSEEFIELDNIAENSWTL